MNSFVIEREGLISNINIIKSRAGDRKIYAVIKGDGYGFGLVQYAQVLRDNGIDTFAVTEPHEVQLLRDGGFDGEILMLRSTAVDFEIESLIKNGAVLTIGSEAAAIAVNGIAGNLGITAKAHIKIDTGMGRYGFSVRDHDAMRSVFDYMENIHVCGIYTHLNAAFGKKKNTFLQIARFRDAVDHLREQGFNVGCVHFANSSAFFRFDDIDFCDAVRIGSAFTGRLAHKANSGLTRVGYLESGICEIRWLSKGDTVGYGGVYRAKQARKIAIVPLGYSHGFGVEKVRDSYRLRDGVRYILQDLKRTLTGEKLYVLVNGKRARVLGHVGMLHTVLDVTDIPCRIGDRAVFTVNPLYVNSAVSRKYI